MPPIGLEAIVVLLAIGIVMGWLAGLVTKGRGFGNFVNIILAAGGAFSGYLALSYLGVQIGNETVSLFLNGISGAVAVLFFASRLHR